MTKILIVDDDNTLRLLLADLSEDNGYSALTAPSGVKGLEVLLANPINLIITDHDMGSGDIGGLGLVKAVREDPKYAQYKEIPIIGVTGEQHTDWNEYINVQLMKPFKSSKVLFDYVRELCKKPNSTQ